MTQSCWFVTHLRVPIVIVARLPHTSRVTVVIGDARAFLGEGAAVRHGLVCIATAGLRRQRHGCRVHTKKDCGAVRDTPRPCSTYAPLPRTRRTNCKTNGVGSRSPSHCRSLRQLAGVGADVVAQRLLVLHLEPLVSWSSDPKWALLASQSTATRIRRRIRRQIGCWRKRDRTGGRMHWILRRQLGRRDCRIYGRRAPGCWHHCRQRRRRSLRRNSRRPPRRRLTNALTALRHTVICITSVFNLHRCTSLHLTQKSRNTLVFVDEDVAVENHSGDKPHSVSIKSPSSYFSVSKAHMKMLTIKTRTTPDSLAGRRASCPCSPAIRDPTCS